MTVTRASKNHIILEEEMEQIHDEETDGNEEQQPDGDADLPEQQTKKTGRNRAKKRKKTVTVREYWATYDRYEENGIQRARCKYCGTTYACDPNKNGNKNVKYHAEKCEKNPANKGKGTQTQLILDNMGDKENCMKLKNWKYDEKAVRAAVVEMVIKDEMPFRSVEKEGLKRAFFAACPLFPMPSRTTIRRDCFKLFTDEREKLKEFLRDSCQSVCVTTDTWTSLQRDNYMCLTAHFIDNDWNLQKRILNFCLIASHKGEAMGRAVEDCLNFWGLSEKLLTVTVDNASANDIACSYMSEMAKTNGSISEGKYLHMRCMAHILNLIVQDGIAHCGKHVDKLRAVIKYVRGSPARLHSFKDLAEKCKVECKTSLVADVCTRWNSTYLMLNSALPYKAVFSRMDIPTVQKSDLGPLSASDWNKIEVLVAYLKEFYNLTNRISGSKYVTSNYMIFHISAAAKVLKSLAANRDTTLQKMAYEMQIKCDKYWGSFEKLNMLMFLPAILDPFYKMRGLKVALQQMFPEDDIDDLLQMVKVVAYEVFDHYVKRYASSKGRDVESVPNPSFVDKDESELWMEQLKEEVTRGCDQEELSRSEFDLFLHERCETKENNILGWWRLNCHRYPILARMARDVLAIPITTVPSESAFSTGGRHLTEYRSCLKPEMVQALVCTQDWLRVRTINDVKWDSLDENDEDLEDTSADLNEGIFFA